MTSSSSQSQQNGSNTEQAPPSHQPAGPTSSPPHDKPTSERVAQLIGKKCLLKCNMNGYAVTALLDTGTQVSLIDQAWRQKYLPHQEIYPLSALMGNDELKVFAANGEAIPYDGWVEVTVNLPGNDNPNYSIKVPFLVSRVDLLRPLLGFNVIQEIILGQGDGLETLSAICNLLKGAMQVETEKVEAVVNFIQAEKKINRSEQVSIKVGQSDIVVHPGQIAHIKFPVPASFTQSIALFELYTDDPHLEQLDMGDGLVEVHQTERPFVEIPVGNTTKHDVIRVSRTTLGSIQPIDNS